jgi:hypothetical protein
MKTNLSNKEKVATLHSKDKKVTTELQKHPKVGILIILTQAPLVLLQCTKSFPRLL